MFKKLRDKEKKLYEIIGIKEFKKVAFGFRKILGMPLLIFLPKQSRSAFLNAPSNYNMKKGNGLKDVRDFKKMLLFNAAVHVLVLAYDFLLIPGLIAGTPTLLQCFFFVFPIVINSYCIMLQRYNHIRIQEAEEKYEKLKALSERRQKRLEEKKRENMNILSEDRVEELTSIFINHPQMVDESVALQEQGYKKIVDIRDSFHNDNVLSPDFWLNQNKQEVKKLTRKVG